MSDVCAGCGLCCMDLPVGLLASLGAGPQAAVCPRLLRTAEGYRCADYEGRPAECREFECRALRDGDAGLVVKLYAEKRWEVVMKVLNGATDPERGRAILQILKGGYLDAESRTVEVEGAPVGQT